MLGGSKAKVEYMGNGKECKERQVFFEYLYLSHRCGLVMIWRKCT